ncbi:MAG: hypothetical protein ACI4TS_05325, partial [Bacteroidaceae bacterium]
MENNYLLAILAGLGASVLVAGILAGVNIAIGSEYFIVLLIGCSIVGVVIRQFVSAHSVGGAIIGGILCPLTYFIYQAILAMFDYYYEKDGEFHFWFLLIACAIFGASTCYSKKD